MLKKMLFGALIALLAFSVIACESTTTSTTATSGSLPTNEIDAVKDETIYLEAATDGTVERAVAVVRLENVVSGLYVDHGIFTAAEDLSGSATILVEAGRLLVPVLSQRVEHYYRAELGEGYASPFLISLSYFKDTLETDPGAVSVESTDHAIVIHVEANPDASEAFRTGYVCALQITLKSDVVQAPDVTGGLVVLAGGNYLISLTALPGSIGDYRIEYLGTGFGIVSIQATFTRFTPAFLGSELSGFATSMPELTEGIAALAVGTAELHQGLFDLSDAVHTLSTGSADLTDGIGQLHDGLVSAALGAHATADALETLADTAAILASGEADLAAAYAGLMLQVLDVQATFSALHPGDMDLLTKLATLSGTAGAIESALSDHLDGMEAFADGLLDLSNQYALFAAGLDALVLAALDLQDGSAGISDALTSIDAALAAMPEGVLAMNAALTTISDGFDDAATALSFLFLEQTDPVSFTSPDNPTPRSVQFIYVVTGF
ncbi:MAG: hypothetical protein Q8N15_07020 [Bacillota bacterium]|nr:hypothetical protein [Bacillota bacterium]